MHTVRLLLKTAVWESAVIDKRFHALAHIHNVTVKHAEKRMTQLNHDHEYRNILEEYRRILRESNPSKETKARKKELLSQMKEKRLSYGLSEYALQSYMKVCARQYAKCLSSQQVQKEVTRVWKGVEKVLFKDGKKIHFRRYEDFTTIGGKSNKNGARFHPDTLTVSWIGLELQCRKPKREKDRKYLEEALSAEISYCEIERKMFPNGWHYYAVVYLRGNAPHKLKTIGTNTMGIDPGTSTIAAVSPDKAVLKELAPRCREYNRKIEHLLQQMELSRRNSNPAKYNAEGTICRSNHDRWQYSNTYLKNRRRLRTLYRKKAEYTKQSHEILCNELLSDANTFITENMSYKGLQKRTVKTERSGKTITVTGKDGSVKQIRKYKRKKRFGRSMNNRSPSLFLRILEQKCALYGGRVLKVDMSSYRASQYDHTTGEYCKAPLSQREKIIEGHKVQRDLYSAYLLSKSNPELNHPDNEACIKGFPAFLVLQEDLIETMKQKHISMKSCFGF